MGIAGRVVEGENRGGWLRMDSEGRVVEGGDKGQRGG